MKQTKLFKGLLASLMLLYSAHTWAYDFRTDGIFYNILSENDLTCEVTGRYYNSSSNKDSYEGEVVIPETTSYLGKTYSVVAIGDYAFCYCSNLADVTIGNSVTSIGECVFANCYSLTKITIGNSVTSIGNYAFYMCTSLAEVTIGNSVTSIGRYAFANCSSLASVTTPNSVTSLGDYTFYECTNLTKVTIGNSVTSINQYTFQYCTSLADVTIGNSVTRIGDGAFYDCTSLKEISIPNSVTRIGNYAFRSCSITEITIPNSVASIGNYAFRGCSILTDVTIGNSVTSIGNYAFSGCSITKITIPNSVISIGSSAFSDCASLTEVTIPSSVIFIGGSAFYRCTSLTEVTSLNPEPPTCASSTFGGASTSTCTLYVPLGTTKIYSEATGWENFFNIEEKVGSETPNSNGYEPDDPFSASEALALAQTLPSSITLSGVYVKGIIVSVTTLDINYGNANYYISDDGSETEQLYIYRGYYLDGAKFTSSSQIKVGDEVIVTGDLVNLYGGSPEINTGSKIYSINGEVGDSGDGGEGHGYEPDDPYTASEAISVAQTLTPSSTLSGVYVKGIIVSVTTLDINYGNATYYISDDGTTGNQLEIYRGYYLNGDKFTSEDQIKIGDEVIVTGDLINYYGNTPELSSGNHIYSINGEGGGSGDGGGSGGDAGGVNINGTTVTLTNEGVSAGSTTAYINMDIGYDNSTTVDGESFTFDDGSTVTFAKNGGSTAPTYYTATKGIRVYALNTMTFSCSKKIANIVMTCDSQSGTDYVGNSTATVEFSDTGAVYCNYHTSSSGGTQLRVQTITIYYEGESDTSGISTVESAEGANSDTIYTIQGVRVNDITHRGIYIINGKKILVK